MFSPSAKAGIGVGDILVTINDWNIEAMDNIQVRQSLKETLQYIIETYIIILFETN